MIGQQIPSPRRQNMHRVRIDASQLIVTHAGALLLPSVATQCLRRSIFDSYYLFGLAGAPLLCHR